MAERDDKVPTEPVNASLSDKQVLYLNNEEKEKELGLLMKDLADGKLQLGMKGSAYMQAVAKLDVYQRTVAKLSTQLKASEAERAEILKERKKSQAFISMLESEYETVIDQLVDCNKDHEQLLRTVDELKHVKEELLRLKVELPATEESKIVALTTAQTAEKDIEMEKRKSEALLLQVSELNEVIISYNLAATAATSDEQLEQMKVHLAAMKDLENEQLEKTILADYYQSELMQAKELLASSMEHMRTAVFDEKNFSMCIEAEAKRLDEELKGSKEKASDLKDQVDKLAGEVQYMKDVLFESNERELDLQVKIAELKSKFHKNRSRIAAAEAAEARALSTQSGLHLAVQQFAVEAEAAKKEAQALKLKMCSGITISVEEYESLIQKDGPNFLGSENKREVDFLKGEVDAANAEIANLKFKLDEAVKRAEMAENAKLAIEDRLRRWREKQKLRRATSLEAAKDQVATRSVTQEKPPALRIAAFQDGKLPNYVPLGKVLNMKY